MRATCSTGLQSFSRFLPLDWASRALGFSFNVTSRHDRQLNSSEQILGQSQTRAISHSLHLASLHKNSSGSSIIELSRVHLCNINNFSRAGCHKADYLSSGSRPSWTATVSARPLAGLFRFRCRSQVFALPSLKHSGQVSELTGLTKLLSDLAISSPLACWMLLI